MAGLGLAVSAGASILDTILNYIWSERAFGRGEALGREAAELLAGGPSLTRSAEDITRALGLPGVTKGGYAYAPAGTTGTIDLGDWFGGKEDIVNAFKGAYGTGYDFGGLIEDVKRQANTGWVSPTGLAEQVGGYFDAALPETEKWLAAKRGEVAAGSEARLQTAGEQQLAAGLARGKGLQEAGDMGRALEFAEQQHRARTGAGLEASAEQMMNEARMAGAEARGGAALTATNINSQLAALRANLTQQVGAQQAEHVMRAAENVANAAMANQQQGNWEAAAQWGALFDMITQGTNVQSQEFQRQLAELSKLAQQGSYIAGIQVPLFQSYPFTTGFSNWVNLQAANQSQKTGGGGFFGIGGVEGGASRTCVAGNTHLITAAGPRMLAHVAVGEPVLGTDGQFHKVVARDYGTVPENEQHDHVRIIAEYAPHRHREILITADHWIQGKPAGDWKAGDNLKINDDDARIVLVTPTEYIVSGDVMLEGNVPYLADGFHVDSMIGRIGLEKWRELEAATQQNGGP